MIAVDNEEANQLKTAALSESAASDEAVLNSLASRAQQLEQRLSAVFAASADAVMVMDESGAIVDANDAASALYGYTKQQLIGKTLQALNPTLPADFLQNWLVEHAPGEVEVARAVNVDQSGRELQVDVHTSSVVVNGRRLLVTVVRDLSPDLSREAAHRQRLNDSEGRFSALFELIDKGVMVHTADLSLQSINAAGRNIFCIDEKQALSMEEQDRFIRSCEFYDQDGRYLDWQQSPFSKAQRGEPVESELIGVYIPQKSAFRWVNISVLLRRDTQVDQSPLILTLFSDVTDLKRDSEFFAQTQALAQVGCWEYDVRARRIFWTPELYRTFGADESVPITIETAFAYSHPAEVDSLQRWWQTILALPEPFEREMRIISASGDTRWIRIVGRPQDRRGTLWRFLGTCQDVTASKTREEQLTRQVQFDTTTGFLNHDSGNKLLQSRIEQADGAGFCVLKIDFDRFTVIRPLLGESLVEQLLNACAKRVRNAIPLGAHCIRMVGDDFLILADAEDDKALQDLADQLSAIFQRPFEFAEESFVVQPAIGVARFPLDGDSVEMLLKNVDAAMSEARARGRKTWQSFSPGLALKMRHRLTLEAQLRKALEREEFHLAYQPKVHLRTGHLTGVEVLLRWKNRLLGEISPDSFIETAEATGDIVPIGAFVLNQALAQLTRWRSRGLMVPHVAVNVSFRQFLSNRFDQLVAQLLKTHGLDGSCLEVEMTERALIMDIDETQVTLSALRAQGVRVIIDDFGEGYSALGYLRRLQLDGIKISHHFMREIPASSTDRILCEAIIAMARNLNLSVVAEGVETSAQADFLLRAGADIAQGFMFSAPLDADALGEFLLMCS